MNCACAILPSVACTIIPYFPNYLVNGTIFVGGGDKVIEDKMRVMIFYGKFG
jgi:hypothetical protein